MFHRWSLSNCTAKYCNCLPNHCNYATNLDRCDWDVWVVCTKTPYRRPIGSGGQKIQYNEQMDIMKLWPHIEVGHMRCIATTTTTKNKTKLCLPDTPATIYEMCSVFGRAIGKMSYKIDICHSCPSNRQLCRILRANDVFVWHIYFVNSRRFAEMILTFSFVVESLQMNIWQERK